MAESEHQRFSLNNKEKFKMFLDRGFLIDFKPPNITAWNYTKNINDYNLEYIGKIDIASFTKWAIL